MRDDVQQIREWHGVTPASFESDIRPLGQPAVLRGLVKEWPLVRRGLESSQAAAESIGEMYNGRPVTTITAPPSENGRFFYSPDLSGYNFRQSREDLRNVLRAILALRKERDRPAIAMQGISAPEFLPEFEAGHAMQLAHGVSPKLWIGNAATVAPHFDLFENIACVAVGRRRFTVFPPEQIANLYVGPVDDALAISMVATAQPDLERFPRFAEAMDSAQVADLDAGDAVYIPYMWWHGVESLAEFNVLVNYWWNDHPAQSGIEPSTALMVAWLAFKDMPEDQWRHWRNLMDHYVFAGRGDSMAHIPANRRGVFGDLAAEGLSKVRQMIARAILGTNSDPRP